MSGNLTTEEKYFLKRLEEQAVKAVEWSSTICTDFLTPNLQNLAITYLQKNAQPFLCCGGYEEAERKRVVLLSPYAEEDCLHGEIALIRLKGKMDYVKVSHRDYLGAILSLGLKREKFGDLIVVDDGCYIYSTAEIVPFVLDNLPKVKGVPLKAEQIALTQWQPSAVDLKPMEVLVSSMRLDSIAAHGFGLSRAKALEAVHAGKIQVNHKEIDQGDFVLKAGDILSFRSKGKIKVKEIIGESKKGKLKVSLLRYR